MITKTRMSWVALSIVFVTGLSLGLYTRVALSQAEDGASPWSIEVVSTIQRTAETLSKPETAEQLATFTKNYYEALLERGFTEQEALLLAQSVGMPTFARR